MTELRYVIGDRVLVSGIVVQDLDSFGDYVVRVNWANDEEENSFTVQASSLYPETQLT